jgi:hypothetical protein
MRRISLFRKAVLAAFAASALAAPACAQDRAEAKVSVNRLSSVLKTKVIIQDDKPAGEIVDVVYADGGCIEYYVASYDNQMYVIPFDAAQVRSADRVVFVDLTPTQFERVSFFRGNDFPNVFAPTYQQQVFTTFNVNVRSGSRNRTTFRPGDDRDGQNRSDRDGANRDRDNAPDRDRTNRDGDRPRSDADRAKSDADRNAPRDRDDRPGTAPRDKADDRPQNEPRDRAPAKPRADAEADAKADADVKTPPKAGVKPPRTEAEADAKADADVSPPKTPRNPAPPAANAPRTPAKPAPKDDNKPLPAPPVVPKS